MKTIDNFEMIRRRVGKDLSWYLGYYSLERARNILHVEWDEAQKTPAKEKLFIYTAKSAAEKMLSERLFYKEKVSMTQNAWESMVFHFTQTIAAIPTFRLSPYLEYIEAWANQDLDWNKTRPVPMKDMEIVHYD